MSNQKDNYTFLTQAPVHHVILKMAVPTIISMLVTSLYNMADTYFVGKLDTQSTAAVGVSFSAMAIIQAIGFFFGHGSGNYISRRLGAKDTANAAKMAATGFFYSIAFGCIIAIFGQLFLTQISTALGSTPTILPYTEQYLGIMLLGAPLMTGSFTLNNQMRFQGNAALSMYGIIAGAILNVGLAPLFIFVFDMGIRGAAIAAVISMACSFCILLAMTCREQSIHINPRNFSFSRSYIKEIIIGGTPSLSRQGLGSISTILLNVAAGAYGDAAIAGMSIVTRITFLVFSVNIGLGQGFQPLCGFCYGAGLYDRVKEGFMYCIKIGTVFLVVLAVFGYIFAEQIVEEFRHDADVVAVGAAAFRWQLITFPLITTILLTNMFLQTIRKPIRANIVAASRNGLFFIPLIILLPHFFGLAGVEMSQAMSDVCSFLISAPIAYSAFRDMKKNG
ncbi:MAG: MATE family efflux transporter [Prevotellaceae bacterium]|nr:MATE family efflux transporter [Prevotellaceae bacterium]